MGNVKSSKPIAGEKGHDGTCYIVGAGKFYGDLIPKAGDLVIAADGGFDTLKKIGVSPDLLIGDMDSIETSCEIEKIVFPTRKDETDTFLAYREGVKRGYTNFVIYGGVGGRDDHTFANYSLLIYGKNRNHNIKIIGERCEIFVIKNEKIEFSGTSGSYFSVFAFSGTAEGVTIKKANYEVSNVTLTPDYPLGVSNNFLDCPCEIEVPRGMLLIMKEL